MKTEQEISEKIEEVKKSLRGPFENLKETYQQRVIEVICTLTAVIHKL